MGYILVIAMMFKSGSGGMGGIDHIEVDSYEECQRIGNAWVESIKKKRKFVNDGEFVFSCIEKK